MADNLINATVSFERTKTKIALYVVGAISIISILCAISMMFSKKSNYVNTTASMVTYTCHPVSEAKNNTSYNCVMIVSYSVAGKTYSGQITQQSNTANLTAGMQVPISYDPSNPTIIGSSSNNSTSSPLALIVCAVVIFAIAYGINYLTQHSTYFATLEGVSDASRLL